MKSIDYAAVGLKVGLEIHQQLKSRRKLFCYCKPQLLTDEPDIIVVRWMRPTLGETGDIDPTMLKEFKKRKRIVYQAYSEHTCLYEIDECPPYDVDEEALETAIMVAKLLKMKIPDVLIVSRKQYLDGSVPSGFQRTMVVALDGELPLSNGKKLRIVQLCLEEDAARKISETEEEVVYRVDRLGIPLVEITTAADLHTPEEVLDAALRIGALLRATGRVLRGIGTIRQDINISIKGGARVEIKGVQRPEWFKPLIDNEIRRQLALIEIADELKKRGVKKEMISGLEPKDVTDAFRNTKSKLIKRAVSRGERVLAVRLPGFGGLLGREILPGKRFGKEFADRVRVVTGLKGIIHTDELPAYGITEEEKRKLFELTGADPSADAVALVIGPKERALEAIEEIKERAKQAIDGVPEETRRAHPDGTTSFERPLGTAARLYPDTDSPPIYLSRELIKRAEESLPRYPWELEEEYSKKYGISRDIAKRLVLSEYRELFERLVKAGVKPKLITSVLFNLMTALRRDGVQVDAIPLEKLEELFVLNLKGVLSKELFPDVLKELARNPAADVKKLVEKLGVRKISREELSRILQEIVDRNEDFILRKGEHAVKGLMGDAMKILRGRVEGKVVYEMLREKVLEKLAELRRKS